MSFDPKTPILEDALRLIHSARDIVWRYEQAKKRAPQEEEGLFLGRIHTAAGDLRAIALKMARRKK